MKTSTRQCCLLLAAAAFNSLSAIQASPGKQEIETRLGYFFPHFGGNARCSQHHGKYDFSGLTDTDMNPSIRDEDSEAVERVAGMTALGRPGGPADIGDVVAFFVSDDARWITGQTLDVNGGLFLGPKEQ